MSDVKVLTKEIAEQFLIGPGWHMTDDGEVQQLDMDLSEYTAIDREAAEVLISDTTEIIQNRIQVLVDELSQFAKEHPSFADGKCHLEIVGVFDYEGYGPAISSDYPEEPAAFSLLELLSRLSCFPRKPRNDESGDLYLKSFPQEDATTPSHLRSGDVHDVVGNACTPGMPYLFLTTETLGAFPDRELIELKASLPGWSSTEHYDSDGDVQTGVFIPIRILPTLVTSLGPYAEDLKLTSVTSLFDETAVLLAKYKGTLFLDLNNLPDSAAQILRNAGHGE